MLEIDVKQQVGTLSWNFEELNNQLEIALRKYDNLVFTNESMQEAKAVRAGLNNVVKDIDNKKKEVKKEFNAPYLKFEEQVKELMSKINNVNAKIDSQIKEYDTQIKAKKKEVIQEYYLSVSTGLEVELEKIFNEKWLNATYKDKDWQGDINSIVDDIKTKLSLIEQLKDRDIVLIKSFYLETLNLQMAIDKEQSIQSRRKAIDEQKAKDEQEYVNHENVAQSVYMETVETIEEEYLVRTFQVKGTKQQLIALGNFMNTNNIQFKKVED